MRQHRPDRSIAVNTCAQTKALPPRTEAANLSTGALNAGHTLWQLSQKISRR